MQQLPPWPECARAPRRVSDARRLRALRSLHRCKGGPSGQRIDTLIDPHVWLRRQSLRKTAKRKRIRRKRQ